MNLRNFLFLSITTFLIFNDGCKQNPTEPSTGQVTTVSGTALDASSNVPLANVRIIDKGNLAPVDTTNSSGSYTLTMELTGNYNTSIYGILPGYASDTVKVSIAPGKDLTSQNIHMTVIDSTIIGVGHVKATAAQRKPAQIAFLGTSATDIFISGVGALENAVFTYQVNDSLGVAIADSPRYGATFSINFFPNSTIEGGSIPKVIPSSDSTDAQGKLYTSIVSGTEAGVVELVARINLDSLGTKFIISQPVKVTVHSGFPDQNHFSLMPARFVFPGYQLYTPYPTFSVAIGDTFSNPVSKGTAVYFHSQSGIIETGYNDFQAYTDKDGLATVNLMTVNPLPDILPYYDPIALNGRKGGFWVWAQTQSRNGWTIIDSVFVISNLAPIVVVQKPDSIVMPRFGVSALYTLEVTDANGNPLCDGTTITSAFVIPAGESGVAFDTYGDLPVTIPIAAAGRFPGWGFTQFQFGVTDNSTTGVNSTTCKINITAPGVGTATVAIPVKLQ